MNYDHWNPETGMVEKRYFAGYDFAPTAILSASATAVMVKEKVEGIDGTYKEHLSNDDWNITIKGVILGDNEYPKEAVRALRNLMNIKAAMKITNLYCENLDINQVVLDSINLPRNPAEPHLQNFELVMSSDKKYIILDLINQ
jgi:hypothetical protein